MMYAKWENGVITPAPQKVTFNGMTVVNPDGEILTALGWLPVISTEKPLVPEGFVAIPSYTESEGQLWESWTVEPQSPVPLTAAPLIEAQITGSGTLHIRDGAEERLRGLQLFGKTVHTTSAPTPTNPTELMTSFADGSVVLQLQGRNRFPFPYYDTSAVKSGITYTVLGDGSILANGTVSGGHADLNLTATAISDFCPEPGVYTLSGCPTGGSYTSYHLLLQCKNGSSVVRTYYETGEGVVVDLRDLTYDNIRCYFRISPGTTVKDMVVLPQFEPGNSRTAFDSPAKLQQLTLSVPGGLAGIPMTYSATHIDSAGTKWFSDEVDLTEGRIIRRLAKVVLDGSEDEGWSVENGNAVSRNSLLPGVYRDSTGNVYGICSITTSSNGILSSWIQKNTPVAEGLLFYSLTTIFGIDPTLDAWLSYLKANPITLFYRLLDPVVTELSEEEKATCRRFTSRKGSFEVITNGDAEMAISYVADTKAYIDGKLEELAATLTAGEA